MKIFIVILNWNRAEDTIKCLRSISRLSVAGLPAKSGYQLTVVVVDNASSDDSVKRIRSFSQKFANGTKKISGNTELRVLDIRKNSRQPIITLITNRTNLGFAGGNNVGIRYAIKNDADYVMILNNDTRVDPGLMVRIIEPVKDYRDFGAASPKIYFEKGYEYHKEKYKSTELGKVIWYAGGKIDWNNVYGSGRGVDEVDKGQYDKITETDYATGTCMLISRQALEKVGSFDEKYFMYYEDTDLSVRIKNAGFKVLYVPTAVIWHKVSQSSGIGSSLNDYFTTRNRLLFGMRYASLRTRFALYKESLRMLVGGRKWQIKGVLDYYFGKYGRGSWTDK